MIPIEKMIPYKAIVISNNELEEIDTRYNNEEISSSNYIKQDAEKRQIPINLYTSKNYNVGVSLEIEDNTIIKTKDISAKKQINILNRVKIRVLGLMDNLEDKTVGLWSLPLNQYTDIPNIDELVDVYFPDILQPEICYYKRIHTETTREAIDFIGSKTMETIINNLDTISEYKKGGESDSDDFKDSIDKLEKIKTNIKDTQKAYNTWITNASKDDVNILKVQPDYKDWISKRDKTMDLIKDYNKLILESKRTDTRYGNCFSAIEPLPEISIYPNSKIFNISNNVILEANDTENNEQFTLIFQKTGEYIRFNSQGQILKSNTDIRSIARNINYIKGKEVQVTNIDGNDIILNKEGIYIWDKNNNVLSLEETGILFQSFSKEKGKDPKKPQYIKLSGKDNGIEILDNSEHKITLNSDGIILEDKDKNTIVLSQKELSLTNKNKDYCKIEKGKIELKSKEVTLNSDKLNLKSSDSATWLPNILPTCPFTGLPHGGSSAGISNLKG